MQSGGGASGRGLGPAVAPLPPGRSSSSSSASPSSSSSAVSAPRVGFESLKQQLAWRQSLQQQQIQHLRKPEEGSLMTHNVGAVQGVAEGGTLPSSSGAPALQSPILPLDNSRQLREVKQPSEHCQEQPKSHMPHAYVQFAMQAAQQQQRSQENIAVPQGGKFGIMGPPLRDQEMHVNNFKMQELTSIRGNQTQGFRFTNSAEQGGHHNRNNKLGNAIDVQKNEMKPTQSSARQFTTASMVRPMQSQQLHGNMGSIANNQLMMAQLQAMQTWAMERNIDLTHPANANLLAQFLPILHSNRLPVMQKPNASVVSAQNSNVSTSKPEVISSPVNSENSAQGNSMNSQHGQDGRTLRSGVGSNLLSSNNMQAHQPLHGVSSAKQQHERGEISGVAGGSSAFSLHQLQHQSQGSVSPSQTIDLPSAKNNPSRSDSLQIQFLKQSQRTPLSPSPLSDASRSQVQVQGGAVQMEKQHIGFTKQQLHVLKAQILAFRRLKRGERALPPEVLQAISPPLLESKVQLPFLPSGANKPEK
ncbi:hypothetical protein HPP92_022593 [Vanilla planifolia]|uniref:QLQ domain-containing protein n=1 Tax=Vanilla planifolia TaxID=51239 RepID=A0A835UFG7_VANPL|nr:hypothetical protein HPP92_022593 [Vanilla planifolia]